MSKPSDPGPPLLPGEEFCDCEPPSGLEYLKATGAALLVVAAGAGLWLGIALATQRLWSFAAVLLGVAAGWLLHRAAGRHRSRALGAMAGGAAVMATATGYALLWLPFVDAIGINRQLTWYHLVMTGLGAFVAYRLAGPSNATKSLSR